MKNLTKIFMAVALLAGAVACVQDKTVDEVGAFQPTSSCITISLADANRTSLGEKTEEGYYPVYWSKGDQVSINGIASVALADVEENAVEGLFEFTSSLEKPYKASYPATEAGKVLFATQQVYKKGSFANGAAAMYGESSEFTLAMKHVSGVLKFPIKIAEGDEVTLSHAVVLNPNGKLSGLYDVELVDGEPVITPTLSASKSLTLNCNELKLSSTPTDLFIAVPAGEYEALKVSLIATDGRVMEYKIKAAGDKAIKAGYVREFNVETGITFSGNGDIFQITDSESLMQFAELCNNGGFAYNKAVLLNDVVFDSTTYSWTPVNGFDFGGEFDGGGFTISGLNNPMFNAAKGYIHDLTLVANAERAADDYNGVGLLACLFKGTISDVTVRGSLTVNGSGSDSYNGFGGVIGESLGGIAFTNVVNEASVTVDGVNNTRNGVAGILGGTQGDGALSKGEDLTFTNCHNKGDIVSLANGGRKRRNMGGLLGYSDGSHSITIISCSNSGDITNETVTEDLHMGGLVGTNMCSMTTVTNSYNIGNVICGGEQDATGNNYSLGGIVGYQTGPLDLTNCVNGATIGEGGVHTKLETANVVKIGTAPGGTALGGIVGYINSSNKYEYLVDKCYNYGTVINTKGTGKGSNNYEGRSGGIVGYINIDGTATISECHNHGTIERDAEDSEWDAKGDCGGILCRVYPNTEAVVTITNCVNEADAKIVFRGAKKDEVNMGGIMAVSGSTTILDNCQNYGVVECYGTMNSAMSVAGIIGNVSSIETVVKDCTNYAAVKQLSGRADRLLVGGIVGYSYSSGTIQDCVNEANGLIEISDVTNANGAAITNASNYIAIGGIVGYARGTAADSGLITRCTNKANIVFNGYSSKHINFGGCVGLCQMGASELTNDGDLTFNGKATTNFRVGGVIGAIEDEVSGLYNNGDLTFNGEAADCYYAGGVGGIILQGEADDTGAASLTTANNTGVITFGGTATDAYYAGGVVGNTIYATNSLTNEGKITFGGTATTAYYAGGVVGNATAELTSLTNSGTLSYGGTSTTSYYIGGVAGQVSNADVSILKNTGDITLGGTLKTGRKGEKNIYVDTPSLGGVVGNMNADALCKADSLVNTASITFAWGASANKSDNWTNGGVIGLSNNYAISKAHFDKNASGVAPKINFTSTSPLVYNSGNNALFVAAGVIGCAKASVAGADITSCHNEGTIYVNSTANNNTHNSTFGGIVAKDDLAAKGAISYCVNDGAWISGTNHKSANKSMSYGGIVGAGSCTNISHCTNNGSVLFESITGYSAKTNYWYSANMGGIAATASATMTISDCTDNGTYTAEANSLTGTAPGRITTMGIIGGGTPKLVRCTANQTITADASCGAHKADASATSYFKQSLYVAGLIGRLGVSSNTTGTTHNWTKTALTCIADGCTITAKLSAPGYDNVAIFTGCTYEEATLCYTPTAATHFPIANCIIKGGNIARGDVSATFSAENFHNYMYKDVPAVATWTAAETLYHGNVFSAE